VAGDLPDGQTVSEAVVVAAGVFGARFLDLPAFPPVVAGELGTIWRLVHACGGVGRVEVKAEGDGPNSAKSGVPKPGDKDVFTSMSIATRNKGVFVGRSGKTALKRRFLRIAGTVNLRYPFFP
jgi:hypothetical protein